MTRAICSRCCRAESVCICSKLPASKIPNQPYVLVLQHPDEKSVFLNSAIIAKFCLANFCLLSTDAFTRNELQRLMLKNGLKRPLLVYPKSDRLGHPCGEAYAEVDLSAPDSGVPLRYSGVDLLLFLDGTWRNTRELVMRNSWLLELPQMGFKNVPPTKYKIRKSQAPNGLSTIESIAYMLQRFAPDFDCGLLLKPFDKMIELQIAKMGEETFNSNYLVSN